MWLVGPSPHCEAVAPSSATAHAASHLRPRMYRHSETTVHEDGPRILRNCPVVLLGGCCPPSRCLRAVLWPVRPARYCTCGDLLATCHVTYVRARHSTRQCVRSGCEVSDGERPDHEVPVPCDCDYHINSRICDSRSDQQCTAVTNNQSNLCPRCPARVAHSTLTMSIHN